MKKIVAILLSAVMLCSAFCINTAAAEKSLAKQQLGEILDCIDFYNSIWGKPSVYFDFCQPAYSDGLAVYEDENASDDECIDACRACVNTCINDECVMPTYAKAVYEMAQKEENYNNWYSEEDWAEYQNALSELKSEIDTAENNVMFSKPLTAKFHSLLNAYNKMTNAYTLKGDLDKDGSVNIADITLLQKYLAGEEHLTGAQKMLADGSYYEDPSIDEVTVMQRYVANMIEEMPNNNVFISDGNKYYMDADLLQERTLNFNICPRDLSSLELQSYFSSYYNNYMGIDYISSYYRWCAENNCQP